MHYRWCTVLLSGAGFCWSFTVSTSPLPTQWIPTSSDRSNLKAKGFVSISLFVATSGEAGLHRGPGWWWLKDKLLDFVEIIVTTSSNSTTVDDGKRMIMDICFGIGGSSGMIRERKRITIELCFVEKNTFLEKKAVSRGCLGLFAVKNSWCKRRLV